MIISEFCRQDSHHTSKYDKHERDRVNNNNNDDKRREKYDGNRDE